MKVQINNLQALERLLGGDTEFEIEIRNSVVQEFAKKHLKAVATSDVLEGMRREVIKQVQNDILDSAPTYYSPGIFTKQLRDRVIDISKEGVRKEIYELALEMFKTYPKLEEFDKSLNNIIDDKLDSLAGASLERKIDKLVDEKIKAKLGL